MVKFILGMVVGGLIMAMIGANNPKATKEAYKAGFQAATSAIAQGTQSASKAATELAKNK